MMQVTTSAIMAAGTVAIPSGAACSGPPARVDALRAAASGDTPWD